MADDAAPDQQPLADVSEGEAATAGGGLTRFVSPGRDGSPMTVPEVFPPDDRLALFVVAMMMAGNDVEYAIRQAVAANPDGATDEERRLNRFEHKVRIANGFLFEGIATLRFWTQDEPDVPKLLATLPQDGRKNLKIVRGLEQQVGSKALEHVRQSTFHYPRPDRSKSPDSTDELGEVIAKQRDVVADALTGPDAQLTFPFADRIGTAVSLSRHDDPHAQTRKIRDGAIAFVRLAWNVHFAYCRRRGIPLTPSEQEGG